MSQFADNEEYPMAIRDALKELNRQYEKVMEYLPHAVAAEEAVDLLVDKGLYRRGHMSSPTETIAHIRTSLGYSSNSLPGALIMIDATDIKDALPMLREMRKRGYKIKRHEDYAEISRRSYYMDNITVSIFLNDGSSTCKYVKIGVKEEPVFELQCDGVAVGEVEGSL